MTHMKCRIIAVTSLVILLTAMFAVISTEAAGREKAMATPQSENLEICLPPIINPPCIGINATVTLPGITITLPRETVSLPRITVTRLLPRVTEIVTLPPIVRTLIQPRRTVTLPAETVRLPGATLTVPGQTAMVPKSTQTITIRQIVTSTGTGPPVTNVITLSPSQSVSIGQETVTRGTVVPTTISTAVPTERRIQLPGVTTFQAAGIGLISLLLLIALMLFALWGGYALGYKNADRENTNFLRVLRDSMGVRGKHR